MSDFPSFAYILAGFFYLLALTNGETEPNDAKILQDFISGMENPELLKWPSPAAAGDPCGPPPWPHVFCSDGRVTQIQVQNLGLSGPLPPNFNHLDKLENLGLQRNKFRGKLPTFRGLSNLQFAYLDFNEFDEIPADFFDGLVNVRVLALDQNPLNETTGWALPEESLSECVQLVNFSCTGCNIIGQLPAFFGQLPGLASLRLSYNRLEGHLPAAFNGSMLQTLWLNDQSGDGMTGPIDVIASMVGLSVAWLHGNAFTGSIPIDIGQLSSLKKLNLNRNRLVGMIPLSLAKMELDELDLSNNMFVGPIPEFAAKNVSYEANSFCQSDPGRECAPEVSVLLEFLQSVEYPARIVSDWAGNDPCSPWLGISCDRTNRVSVINLQRMGMNGTISPVLANLSSVVEIHLEGNNLHGVVPGRLTEMRTLRLLNLARNDIEPPLPRFPNSVKVVIDGNVKFQNAGDKGSPSPAAEPAKNRSSSGAESPFNDTSSSANHDHFPLSSTPRLDGGTRHKPPSVVTEHRDATNSGKSRVMFIAAAAGGAAIVAILAIILAFYCLWRRAKKQSPSSSIMIHPKDLSDHRRNTLKYTVSDGPMALEARTGSHAASGTTTCTSGNVQVIDSGNMLISLHILRKVTNDFAQENELGRGGFGVVYKGELEDGAKLAVKRMVAGVISNKALDEFQSEIAVLTKVRHRNLVSLLGYAAEGSERLLVYEYMPQGALSRHLFHWKSHQLEPLSWTRRLNIALDVARGVEYLHSLAQHSFIHRDLKSANILLDDDFRAKVSDFGLVKLAPDRERSVATRLAGTFGYLAPEYAVTGKITTKVDVFSFGVVLMELLTGLVALDEQRPEEKRYLAEWFWQIKSNRESLIASIDPALDAKEDNYDTIETIATLAGHCTARDQNHRPEMGHAVNVLGQLVEQWKPYEETDELSGIDLTLPLPQMLKGWQEEADSRDVSGASQDSKGSIPAKPAGFADSFTSADAR